ncbi:MAG TPA: alpha/beta hydrolase [Geminicoccaceae bacterium]
MDPRERAELDAQYNNRARVPDFQRHLDACARDSEVFRARAAGALLDLAYGAGGRQAVDLFPPPGSGGAAPLLVFIHGGYWQGLSRKDFSYVAAPFVARGAAVAVVGYDLAPEVEVGTIVEQIRAALIFLQREARGLGLDTGRIVVSGHSAGGHLAAMALATDWVARGGPADLLAGVVAISGLFDLEPIRRCYLNDVLGLDEAEARRLSPIRLDLPADVPVVVAVGGAESEEFLRQSQVYVEHLKSHLKKVEHRVENGLDHFTIVRRFGEPGHPLVGRTLGMLGLAEA